MDNAQTPDATPPKGWLADPKHRWAAIVVGVVVLLLAAYFYIEHQEKYPSTDDAYVHGNIIYIAPQVGGKLSVVNAHNYQQVQEGELLFQIDPSVYNAQLKKATAAFKLASQQNKADSAGIIAASTNINTAVAELHKVQLNYRRTMTLVQQGALPETDADTVRADLVSAQQTLKSSKATLLQLVAEQGAKGMAAPAVQEAAANLMLATLNVAYCNIAAPVDGELGVVSVHKGSVVTANQALVPLVQADSAWVAANYKETDLGRIQPGMPATVVLDMYPDTTYQGVVTHISPASGSSFSLLPPENATGNWVKITQRFPVSVAFDKKQHLSSNYPLRVGASATVTVDTTVTPR